jgi:hypothetical protein
MIFYDKKIIIYKLAQKTMKFYGDTTYVHI